MKQIITYLHQRVLASLSQDDGERYQEILDDWLADNCFDLDNAIINDLGINDPKIKELLSILELSYREKDSIDSMLEKAEKLDQIREALSL